MFNLNGYAGVATSMEIGFAVALGKPIYALETDQEIDRNVLYDGYLKNTEEILRILKS